MVAWKNLMMFVCTLWYLIRLYFVWSCKIILDFVRSCQILLDVIRSLSNPFRSCRILSDLVESCQILSVLVRFCTILFIFVFKLGAPCVELWPNLATPWIHIWAGNIEEFLSRWYRLNLNQEKSLYVAGSLYAHANASLNSKFTSNSVDFLSNCVQFIRLFQIMSKSVDFFRSCHIWFNLVYSCFQIRCVLCGTVAKSRNSLHSHMSRQHRGISTKVV